MILDVSSEHLRIQAGCDAKASVWCLDVSWTEFAHTYEAVMEVGSSLYRWKIICIGATG